MLHVLERVGRQVQRLLDVVEAVDQGLVTAASLSEVVPSASRLSATKPCTSPTAALRSLTASATSSGSSAISAGHRARFWLSWRIRSALS